MRELVHNSTGCPKKNYHFTFCLIFLEPKNRITNRFHLLKIEINVKILNTEPVWCTGHLYQTVGLFSNSKSAISNHFLHLQRHVKTRINPLVCFHMLNIIQNECSIRDFFYKIFVWLIKIMHIIHRCNILCIIIYYIRTKRAIININFLLSYWTFFFVMLSSWASFASCSGHFEYIYTTGRT